MTCPSCFKNPATTHPHLGVLPCAVCQTRQALLVSPEKQAEIIPERIKSERQERQDSIEQPHFKGELNKRYIDLWGEDEARKRGFSEKEIKNAKYVMDQVPGIRYYKDRT